jgi:hypothetical protein
MGLIKRSGGGTKIPPGEKLRFKIEKAAEDEGDYGPQAQFSLKVLGGKYAGEQLLEWGKLAQPRLNRVQKMREEGLDDKAIAKSLKKSGLGFKKKIDEPEVPGVADGGKVYNIGMAAFHGDVGTIDSFESVPALLEALEGRTFVSITKPRGKSGEYAGVTWDQVYPDLEASGKEPAPPSPSGPLDSGEDFDDLPFGDDPEPAF